MVLAAWGMTPGLFLVYHGVTSAWRVPESGLAGSAVLLAISAVVATICFVAYRNIARELLLCVRVMAGR